jgi:hypothetical protein
MEQMTPKDRHSSHLTPDDVIRDDRLRGFTDEEADQAPRRKSPKPAGPGEPSIPMSPTPQRGPLGDEPEDPVDPATPPGETIR